MTTHDMPDHPPKTPERDPATKVRPTATQSHPAKVRPRDRLYRSRSHTRRQTEQHSTATSNKRDQLINACAAVGRCAETPRAKRQCDYCVTMSAVDLRRWTVDRILNPRAVAAR